MRLDVATAAFALGALTIAIANFELDLQYFQLDDEFCFDSEKDFQDVKHEDAMLTERFKNPR